MATIHAEIGFSGESERASKVPIRYGPILWALTVFVVGLCYFEVVRHFFLIKALGGYLIKIWLPPALLLAVLLLVKLERGCLAWQERGLAVGHLFLAGYVGFGLMSLFATESLFNVGKLGLIMFAPVVVYLIILEIVQTNEAIERLLVWLFWAGVLFALHAQYVFLVAMQSSGFEFETFQTNVGEMDTGTIATFHGEGVTRGETMVRTTLPGLEQTKFSAMLALLCLSGLYMSKCRGGWLKIGYLAGCALMFVTVIATLSRSTLAAFVVGLVTYIWYSKQHRALLVPFLGLGAILVMTNDFFIDRLLLTLTGSGWFGDSEWVQALALARGLSEIRPEAHLDTMPVSLDLFMSSPFLGVGISHMQSVVEVEEHNRYLYMLSTTGVLTLLPYVGFIVWMLLKVRAVLKSKRGLKIEHAQLGHLMAAALVFSLVKLNAENSETFYYWVFFALAAAWTRHAVAQAEDARSV